MTGKWIRTHVYDRPELLKPGETKYYVEMMHTGTGAYCKVPLASDNQWGYLESLRSKYTNRAPLKNRPYAHHATKQIQKLLEKKVKLESQGTLFDEQTIGNTENRENH